MDSEPSAERSAFVVSTVVDEPGVTRYFNEPAGLTQPGCRVFVWSQGAWHLVPPARRLLEVELVLLLHPRHPA